MSRFTLLLALIAFTILPIASKADAPVPVQDMAYARVGSDLFVQGGYVAFNNTQQSISSQFYALDLSTSWSTSSPPWRALLNGNPSRSFSGLCTADNQTFLTIVVLVPTYYRMSTFSKTGNSWNTLNLSNNDSMQYGFRPVMDLDTGLIHIAGQLSMDVYDRTGNSWTSSAIPAGVLTQRYFGQAVYNRVRKTIMYFGGYDYGVAGQFEPSAVVTEYSPSSGNWSIFKTIDAIPTPRADFCMAISDDSNNIVVFGGRTSISPQTFVGTIYILDISTTSWKQGPSLSFSRIYSACTIVGNQFVAWGGSDGNNTSSGTPLVYDLTSNLWVNNYTAPAYYANAPHPSSGSGTSSTGSGGNGGSNGTGGPTDSSSNTGSGSVPVGAIAGGVVGALLVGVLGATLFFVRKRKIERARTEELAQKKMLRAAELTNNFQERNNDHDGRSRTVTTTSVPVPGSGSPPDYTTREVISPIPQTLKMKESGNYNNPHTTYINTVSMTGIGNNSQDFGSPNLRRNPQEVQEGQFNDYHDQDSLTRSKNPQAMNSGFSQQNSADVSFYEDLKL